MKRVTFHFVVFRGDDAIAFFVGKNDAVSFSKEGDKVFGMTAVEVELSSLQIPRRNLAGDRAHTAAECIGFW